MERDAEADPDPLDEAEAAPGPAEEAPALVAHGTARCPNRTDRRWRRTPSPRSPRPGPRTRHLRQNRPGWRPNRKPRRGPGAAARASGLIDAPEPIVLPRVLAIANQKGGVGKTTTAVNLGAALAELGYRVLVVDLDPQGNATTGLGINPRDVAGSIYDVIMNDVADRGLRRADQPSRTCSWSRRPSTWPAPRSSWSRPSAGS